MSVFLNFVSEAFLWVFGKLFLSRAERKHRRSVFLQKLLKGVISEIGMSSSELSHFCHLVADCQSFRRDRATLNVKLFYPEIQVIRFYRSSFFRKKYEIEIERIDKSIDKYTVVLS